MIQVALYWSIFMRVMQFISVYDKFTFLVSMIGKTIVKTVPFMIVLIACDVQFTFIFMALGIQITPDLNGILNQYPAISKMVRFLIQSYRNSIGDLSPPIYKAWLEGEYSEGQVTTVAIMSWASWIGSTLLNQIILLNFLIAVIS